MNANSINSISEFLLHAGTEYIVFDMGRRLTALDNQAFLDIENGSTVAPFPRQQHAWFGIVFWNKNSSNQHYIWFIKLPLDEQGLVVAASRNHFLQIIVDALGQSISDDSEAANTLPENQPISVSAQYVIAYVKAPQVADWQTIPLQAIADVVIRLDSMENAQEVQDSVLRNFSLFAEPFQRAFMEMAEVANVSERLNQCMLSVLDGDEISLAALRGLSCETKNDTIYTQLVSHFEAKKLNRLDILSVIAARHFQQMDEKLLLLFFEAVAEVDNQENYNGDVFRGFFSDLVQVPQLRELVLGILRTPERSDLLASAIGTLFSQTRGNE
jgi:hypothetical protein